MRMLFIVYLASNALALMPADAAAQGKRQDGARPQQMKQEERQRMRDDMHDVNRDRGQARQDRQQRPMTPQEREKLRRDIQDANRDLKKR
jgi:hypothetical protein